MHEMNGKIRSLMKDGFELYDLDRMTEQEIDVLLDETFSSPSKPKKIEDMPTVENYTWIKRDGYSGFYAIREDNSSRSRLVRMGMEKIDVDKMSDYEVEHAIVRNGYSQEMYNKYTFEVDMHADASSKRKVIRIIKKQTNKDKDIEKLLELGFFDKEIEQLTDEEIKSILIDGEMPESLKPAYTLYSDYNSSVDIVECNNDTDEERAIRLGMEPEDAKAITEQEWSNLKLYGTYPNALYAKYNFYSSLYSKKIIKIRRINKPTDLQTRARMIEELTKAGVDQIDIENITDEEINDVSRTLIYPEWMYDKYSLQSARGSSRIEKAEKWTELGYANEKDYNTKYTEKLRREQAVINRLIATERGLNGDTSRLTPKKYREPVKSMDTIEIENRVLKLAERIMKLERKSNESLKDCNNKTYDRNREEYSWLIRIMTIYASELKYRHETNKSYTSEVIRPIINEYANSIQVCDAKIDMMLAKIKADSDEHKANVKVEQEV